MHYIHRLTPGQKKAAIGIFAGIPLAGLALLFVMWGYNQGLFKRTITLTTTVRSAQGLDTGTPVTFSGMKVGRVTAIRLGKAEEVVLTLQIEREYAARIHADSVAITASASVLGIKEIKIRPGSPEAPPVKDGDTLASAEMFDMDNLMNRVSPILEAAEKIVFRVDKILTGIPDDKLNAAISDTSAILGKIREGKTTVGRLVAGDNGEFYVNLDRLANRLATLAERLNESTKRLPETMDNVAVISGNLKTSSAQWPEMHHDMAKVMKNLDRLITDLREMTPALKKTAVNVGNLTEEIGGATSRVPLILDDMESTLNETLTIVRGVKSSWPVSGMVPEPKPKRKFEPAQREPAYGRGR